MIAPQMFNELNNLISKEEESPQVHGTWWDSRLLSFKRET